MYIYTHTRTNENSHKRNPNAVQLPHTFRSDLKMTAAIFLKQFRLTRVEYLTSTDLTSTDLTSTDLTIQMYVSAAPQTT